jgi:hypothetical protein
MTEGEWIVGGSDGCHVVIDRKQVSSQHLAIMCTGTQIFIRDLESTNGTFVNGTRIYESEVSPSDLVGLGSYEVQVSVLLSFIDPPTQNRGVTVVEDLPRKPAMKARPASNPNLTTCQSCGKSVSKSAGTCPSCGHPQRGVVMASVPTPTSPPAQPQVSTPPPVPNSHMVQAIIATLLCFLPFGLVAIIHAGKVDGAHARGDYGEASRRSEAAKHWVNYSVIVAVVLVVLYVVGVENGWFKPEDFF